MSQFFVSTLYFQHCSLFIDRIFSHTNIKYANFSVVVFQNEADEPLLNVTIVLFKQIVKMSLFIKINLPKESNDLKYERELFRTSIDVKKISQGYVGSFVLKMAMDNFYKAANFTLELPLKKVCSICVD